jgi:hypothetical protein
VKNRIVIAAIVLVLVFLAGFVPQYARARRLDNELRQAREGNAAAQVRDLIALAYVQANQLNYGLAADTVARFFNRTRELANQTEDPAVRKSLEDLLTVRDKVIGELAKGDAAVMADLRDLFMKTRQTPPRNQP